MTGGSSKVVWLAALAASIGAGALGCDRPRAHLWTAKSVRLRPGEAVRAAAVADPKAKADGAGAKEAGPGEAAAGKALEVALKAQVMEGLAAMAAAAAAGNEPARRAALEGLLELDRERSQRPIIDVLITNLDGLGQHAARVIGEMKDERLLQHLTKPLKGTDVFVATAVAEAIGTTGSAAANNQLVSVMTDSKRPASVRAACAQALGAIGNVGAVEPLLETLRAEDEEVQVAAAVALGQLKDLRALDPLRAKLKEVADRDPEVEVQVANTLLRSFGDPDALPHLVRRLIGGSEQSRVAAFKALQAHDSPRTVAREMVDLLVGNPGNFYEVIGHLQNFCAAAPDSDCVTLAKQRKKEIKGGPAVNAINQALEVLAPPD